MKTHLRAALTVFGIMTLATGFIYPALVTLVAQLAFPHQANGSVILRAGKPVGSELIGQTFDEPRYFWGRPSATDPASYNSAASTGSNRGPTNPDLLKSIAERAEALRAAHPEQSGAVPVDLVTASASGLDPHISPAAAIYQVERIARLRGLTASVVLGLIHDHSEARTFGLLGEPRVNVLTLNLALDALKVSAPPP